MSKFAVVYWSGTSNTESMAQFVAEGIRAGGGEADLFTAGEFTPDLAGGYEGLALGCSAPERRWRRTSLSPCMRPSSPCWAGRSWLSSALTVGAAASGCEPGPRTAPRSG